LNEWGEIRAVLSNDAIIPRLCVSVRGTCVGAGNNGHEHHGYDGNHHRHHWYDNGNDGHHHGHWDHRTADGNTFYYSTIEQTIFCSAAGRL
jgi:hypothetical protein